MAGQQTGGFRGRVVVVGHTMPSWACIAGPPTGLVNIIPATRRVAAKRATARAKHLPLQLQAQRARWLSSALSAAAGVPAMKKFTPSLHFICSKFAQISEYSLHPDRNCANSLRKVYTKFEKQQKKFTMSKPCKPV